MIIQKNSLKNFNSSPSSTRSPPRSSSNDKLYSNSYSITSTHSGFDRSPEIDVKRKKPSKKTIKHQVFADALDYTNDNFWRKKLDDASRGKFPPGFRYVNDKLHYKQNKIEISKIPIETSKNFIEFLQREAQILSDIDHQYSLKKAELNVAEKEILTWNNASKNTKSKLINDYAEKIMKSEGMSRADKENLRSIIYAGTYMKTFNKNTIIIENEKIVNIVGLCKDPKTNTYYIKPAKSIKRSKENNEPTEIIIPQIYKPSRINLENDWNNVVGCYEERKNLVVDNLMSKK